MLTQAVYTSIATQRFSDKELRDMTAEAAARNQPRQVTGVLVFSGGQFIQVLEGDAEQIDALLERIGTDERHTNFTLLSQGQVPGRTFGDWPMGLMNLDAVQQTDVTTLRRMTYSDARLNPKAGEVIVDRLKAFRHLLPVTGRRGAAA